MGLWVFGVFRPKCICQAGVGGLVDTGAMRLLVVLCCVAGLCAAERLDTRLSYLVHETWFEPVVNVTIYVGAEPGRELDVYLRRSAHVASLMVPSYEYSAYYRDGSDWIFTYDTAWRQTILAPAPFDALPQSAESAPFRGLAEFSYCAGYDQFVLGAPGFHCFEAPGDTRTPFPCENPFTCLVPVYFDTATAPQLCSFEVGGLHVLTTLNASTMRIGEATFSIPASSSAAGVTRATHRIAEGDTCVIGTAALNLAWTWRRGVNAHIEVGAAYKDEFSNDFKWLVKVGLVILIVCIWATEETRNWQFEVAASGLLLVILCFDSFGKLNTQLLHHNPSMSLESARVFSYIIFFLAAWGVIGIYIRRHNDIVCRMIMTIVLCIHVITIISNTNRTLLLSANNLIVCIIASTTVLRNYHHFHISSTVPVLLFYLIIIVTTIEPITMDIHPFSKFPHITGVACVLVIILVGCIYRKHPTLIADLYANV